MDFIGNPKPTTAEMFRFDGILKSLLIFSLFMPVYNPEPTPLSHPDSCIFCSPLPSSNSWKPYFGSVNKITATFALTIHCPLVRFSDNFLRLLLSFTPMHLQC